MGNKHPTTGVNKIKVDFGESLNYPVASVTFCYQSLSESYAVYARWPFH